MSETIISSGVDVGSSAIKIAIMSTEAGSGRKREGAKILGTHVERLRRRDAKMMVDVAYGVALRRAGIAAEDVQYVASTGEGELVDFRVGHFYGMTTHARGAVFLDPEARAVVDVGALHARAIKFDERAKVLGYRMTNQCASGSGQFLENIARYLGVTLQEVGPLSLESTDPEKVSSICAVLAETDVINMVTRGIALSDIIKGIHESMAWRFVKLLRSLKIEGSVLITGGLSADVGLVKSVRDAIAQQVEKGRLSSNVVVRTHDDAVLAGAFGAALWGAYRYEKMKGLKSAA